MPKHPPSYETQQNRIREATERLEAGVRAFLGSDRYTDYLKVMSRFHNYSCSNSVLIALQRPDASLVAGYTAWEKKFGRHPKKGSHGIQIFAPAPVKTNQYLEQEKIDPDTHLPVLDENEEPVVERIAIKRAAFKVVTVFDVSDTEGRPLPELDVHPLSGSVSQYEALMEAIRRTATVPIEMEAIAGASNGYYSPAEKRIAIREGMSELQTIKTAIHELAHSRLHDIDTTNPASRQAVQKSKATREVEAESTAFVVSEHFGLDTSSYSFGYVGSWSSDRTMPELKASLQTIRDAANGIISEMEQHLQELHQEREQAAEESISGQEESIPGEAASPDVEQPDSGWRYYIVPDLMTWTAPGNGTEQTPKESYPSFEEAASRFRELRRLPCNAEPAGDETANQPYARLTFGMERREPAGAVDLLHVQADRHVLPDDFTHLFPDEPEVLATLSQLGSEFGFEQVSVRREMGPEEVKASAQAHFSEQLAQSSLPPKAQQQYLDSFDLLYKQGQMEHLKPAANQQVVHELLSFPEWKNPYFSVTDTPERLAFDIDLLAFRYDSYDYSDPSGRPSLYPQVLEQIKNHQTDDIKAWLSGIAAEDSGFQSKAAALLERLNTLSPAPEVEEPVQKSEPASVVPSQPQDVVYQIGSRYLHIQSAPDGLWDYAIFDRNLEKMGSGRTGEPSMGLAEVRDTLLRDNGFSQDAPITEITPKRFGEMLAEQERNLRCPICYLSAVEARAQDALDTWRMSHHANQRCARQFSKEYGLAYHNRQVPEFLQKMVDRYGLERCKLVLAATIQHADWDGRYHKAVRDGANQVKVPGASDDPDRDNRFNYLVTSHPVMVDVAFRDLMAMEQRREHDSVPKSRPAVKQAASGRSAQAKAAAQPEKRPSVLKRLREKQAALSCGVQPPKAVAQNKPQL